MTTSVAIVHARNRKNSLWLELSRLLEARGREVETHYTESAGHARHLARKYAPTEGVLMAVGGDGTFSETVNGWLEQPERGEPAFLLVPLGTGNDFARDQELPADAETLAATVMSPRIREIDLAYLTYQGPSGPESCYYVVGATVGFSAEVTRFFCQLPRLLPGTAQYLFSLLVSLIRWKNVTAEIESDGDLLSTSNLFNLNIANTRFYGGGMYSSPRALADSGQLEMVGMELNKLQVLKAMPNNYNGKFDDVQGVTQKPVFEMSVRTPVPVPVQADGEYLGTTPISIRVHPGLLKLAVPAG